MVDIIKHDEELGLYNEPFDNPMIKNDDVDLKEVVEKLSEIYRLNKFKNKTPTIGFFMPGLIYAVNGISPYTYAYYNLPRDSIAIERSKIDDLILLVTDAVPLGKNITNALLKKRIKFPEDFTIIDSFIYYKQSSYLKVYKLANHRNEY